VWVVSWVGWDKNRRALSVFSFVRSGDRFLAKKNLPKINEVKEIHISFTSAVGVFMWQICHIKMIPA